MPVHSHEVDGAAAESALQVAAQELGFAAAALLPARALPAAQTALADWLAAGHHGDMQYMAQHDRRDDPERVLEEARCMIVAILPYPRGPRQSTAWYAQGADYHHIVRQKLDLLGERLRTLVNRPASRWRACVDTPPLFERAYAEAAGLAFIGKNSLAIAPGAGSTFFIGVLLTDVPLDILRRASGASVTEKQAPGCGRCTSCIDRCPTQAIVAPYVVDARRCIAYLTIEYRGSIPIPLRRPIGEHLFGCDICQSVCPFNAGSSEPAAPLTRLRRRGVPELRLRGAPPTALQWLSLSASAYRRLVKGSAYSRCSRQQLGRNAAVVLGNRLRTMVQGSPGRARRPEGLDGLLHSLSSRYPLIRGHAVWALGEACLSRVSGPGETAAVVEALRRLARNEEAEGVRGEISAAWSVMEQAGPPPCTS